MTDQGRGRANNEDSVWVDQAKGLVVVADGIGGHRSGEKASTLAVSSIREHFDRLSASQSTGEVTAGRFSDETRRLAFCVKLANQAIFEAARQNPDDKGMGTTCTAAIIRNGRLGLAHVGDSRCYLVRRGVMTQLTEDHSLATHQARQGVPLPEATAAASQNILTRALGTEAEVTVDIDEHPLFPGGRLVLCSDGLDKEVEEDDLLRTVLAADDPEDVVRRLIDQTNAADGQDNITVAAARLDRTGPAAALGRILRLFSPKRSADRV
jgi:serine/threonine protein phosphatase PrpC